VKKGVRNDPETRFGRIPPVSRKIDPKTGKRRNLGTFASQEQARQHEREVQYFKRHH